MGGPFERMFLLLEVFGDDLDPADVSALLGTPPDEGYKKGDERPRGSQYYKTGGWILKSGEIRISEDRTGEERLHAWAASIPGDAAVWTDLKDRFLVQVRLVGYTDQWNADFTLPPAMLENLSKRGLPLMIDPYLSLDAADG